MAVYRLIIVITIFLTASALRAQTYETTNLSFGVNHTALWEDGYSARSGGRGGVVTERYSAIRNLPGLFVGLHNSKFLGKRTELRVGGNLALEQYSSSASEKENFTMGVPLSRSEISFNSSVITLNFKLMGVYNLFEKKISLVGGITAARCAFLG